MAKGQQLGFTSVTVWMIVFVGLWLASTVFLVILYTGQEQLKEEAGRAREAKAKLISSAEERSIELLKAARSGGPTLVGLLEGARAESARLATGESADDPATVQGKLQQQLRTIQSERLVSDPESYEDLSYDEALTTLYQEFSATHGLKGDAEERVGGLQAEVDRLVEANSQQKNELDKRATELGDLLAEEQAGRAQYRAERDEEIAKLKRDYDERRDRHNADLTEARQRGTMLEERVALLQERLAAMQEKFGELMIGPDELSTARHADGRILTAVPGDNVVYVNLGRKDRLTRGLRFAVYSADTGIPPDGRGKAQIEVASISESSAECKILSVAPRQVILEGDLIANPIYDPDRPPRFLVLGDFDLDHDGSVDLGGTATIESMIEEWGGEVVTDLTALTDFVVIGRAPRRPRRAADASSEQAQRFSAMQQLHDRYVSTIAGAKSLAVPIMTQEVFLNFLGYSGR